MPLRWVLAALLAVAIAAPAASAATVPRKLFVIGDSLAFDNHLALQHRLPNWTIEKDFSFARMVKETVRDLRKRLQSPPPLARIIHVSSGTGDDPWDPVGFRRSIRQIMRAAGPRRCVIWANVYRHPIYNVVNQVLADEDAKRENLRVIDWNKMVIAHEGWLVDPIHVNEEGNRARAREIAKASRACRSWLSRP